MSSDLLDEETKKIVIKKTWCHGQLIAPVYGLICAYWALSSLHADVRLWLAAVVMPSWSYLSYKAISTQPPYRTLLVGGTIAELTHIGVFSLAIHHTSETIGLLMTIASVLFFVETAAFLAVVTWLRSTLEEDNQRLLH